MTLRFGEVFGYVNQVLPWNALGLAAALALIVLLSIRELVRAYYGPRAPQQGRSITPVVLALLAVFVVAVVERVAYRFFIG